MNPRVKNVKPENNYTLLLTFTNGEVRRFDMKPYLEKGLFKELKEESLFQTAHPDGLSVEWENEAALCPDTLYLGSVAVE
ncbi:MAG: DUF2442 domain-containing protein [Tannerella sp.]|jgi:hypothetical protein|nr:DUF2442 domain-containing protein [Tannerella sp.]